MSCRDQPRAALDPAIGTVAVFAFHAETVDIVPEQGCLLAQIESELLRGVGNPAIPAVDPFCDKAAHAAFRFIAEWDLEGPIQALDRRHRIRDQLPIGDIGDSIFGGITCRSGLHQQSRTVMPALLYLTAYREGVEMSGEGAAQHLG